MAAACSHHPRVGSLLVERVGSDERPGMWESDWKRLFIQSVSGFLKCVTVPNYQVNILMSCRGPSECICIGSCQLYAEKLKQLTSLVQGHRASGCGGRVRTLQPVLSSLLNMLSWILFGIFPTAACNRKWDVMSIY